MMVPDDALLGELYRAGLAQARRRVKVQGAVAPEDVVQDALADLLAYGGPAPADLPAFFATLVRWGCIRAYREETGYRMHHRRRRCDSLDAPLRAGDDAGAPTTLADLLAWRGDVCDLAHATGVLRRVLAASGEHDGLAMAVYAACGYSHAAIGRRFGLSAKAVGGRIERARATDRVRALRAAWGQLPTDRAAIDRDRATRRTAIAPNPRAARLRAVTHCPQGHPYDAANTGRRRNGARRCKACARDYQRARGGARREG